MKVKLWAVAWLLLGLVGFAAAMYVGLTIGEFFPRGSGDCVVSVKDC